MISSDIILRVTFLFYKDIISTWIDWQRRPFIYISSICKCSIKADYILEIAELGLLCDYSFINHISKIRWSSCLMNCKLYPRLSVNNWIKNTIEYYYKMNYSLLRRTFKGYCYNSESEMLFKWTVYSVPLRIFFILLESQGHGNFNLFIFLAY